MYAWHDIDGKSRRNTKYWKWLKYTIWINVIGRKKIKFLARCKLSIYR
jgi:hypothetical protein